MSLLRELYEETSAAATSGGDVAVYAEPLIAKPKRRVNVKRIKFKNKKKFKSKINEVWNMNDGEFDAHDVLSKLDAAETKSKHQSDSVTFGLEDDQGNVVRVIVAGDQAKDFEQTLSRMLGDQFDDTIENYNGTPAKEIAEILFQLKDRFNIIDVKWGNIPTDEDEEPEMKSTEQDSDMDEDQTDTEIPDDLESAEDGPDQADNIDDVPMPDNNTNDETSLLKKVIDMMKMDAEARKAEAAAREAEAKATVSKYASDTAQAKLKQEEQILDMEAYYKSKKDQEKEAKNLAKLAKYKHDIASDDGEGLSYQRSEDEETVSIQSLADVIVQRLKGR